MVAVRRTRVALGYEQKVVQKVRSTRSSEDAPVQGKPQFLPSLGL
jgi:hypothetical protein